MTTGEKIATYRKKNNMTQEQLAELLQVSRQSVSKWESDLAFPETEKLLRLSKLFHCTVDHLLVEDAPRNGDIRADAPIPMRPVFRISEYEYKSDRTVCGRPLVHVCFRRRACACGIIAVGFRARGVISLGLLSLGVISLGLLSVGMFAFGVLALGLLACGSFCAGVFSFGAIALGLLTAVGGIAVGSFAAGGVAVGNYFAYGGYAIARVALGNDRASGSAWSFVGELPPYAKEQLLHALYEVTPRTLHWLVLFVRALI